MCCIYGTGIEAVISLRSWIIVNLIYIRTMEAVDCFGGRYCKVAL